MTKLEQPAEKADVHYHKDEHGILQRCYHTTKTNWKAWIIAGIIALFAYPVEHYVWEHVPPFNSIAKYLGVGIEHGD